MAGWAISPRSPYVGGGGGKHEKDGKNTARSESEKQRENNGKDISVNACCLGSERLNKVLARVGSGRGGANPIKPRPRTARGSSHLNGKTTIKRQ